MNKRIDEQLLMDLADQVGLLPDGRSLSEAAQGDSCGGSLEARQEAWSAAQAMKGKSEEEILSEILRLKSRLQQNPAAYEKQIRAVKSLRKMMNPAQRQRLDRVLQLLEE